MALRQPAFAGHAGGFVKLTRKTTVTSIQTVLVLLAQPVTDDYMAFGKYREHARLKGLKTRSIWNRPLAELYSVRYS